MKISICNCRIVFTIAQEKNWMRKQQQIWRMFDRTFLLMCTWHNRLFVHWVTDALVLPLNISLLNFNCDMNLFWLTKCQSLPWFFLFVLFYFCTMVLLWTKILLSSLVMQPKKNTISDEIFDVIKWCKYPFIENVKCITLLNVHL